MSGAGIIVGKAACCCPRGCTFLDLASWMAPTDKYEQLAITCGISGNWYRTSLSGGCGASWNASISGGDADRYGGTVLTFPQWFSPFNQTIGGGSHPSMVGRLYTSVFGLRQQPAGTPGQGWTNWDVIQDAAPACPGQSKQELFLGFGCTVQVAYETDDPQAACYPFVGMGPAQDTTGFAVSYVKRCCNYQDGPLGTYHRIGPATQGFGPTDVNYTGGFGGPTHTVFFTRTAADTLTVTEEL